MKVAIIDPSNVIVPTSTPRGGWLRVGWIAGVPVIVNSFNKKVSRSPSYTRYALTPIAGNYQKTLHARGTKELSFSIDGELSLEGASIISFMASSFRGTYFSVEIFQEYPLVMPNCVMDNFSLQGSPDSIVSYSLSGKRLSTSLVGETEVDGTYHHAVPSWSTGNDSVVSWTLSHSVALNPVYGNNNNSLPAYYRCGESEISFVINSVGTLKAHDTISIGIGAVALLQGLIVGESEESSGEDGYVGYTAELTNCSLTTSAYTAGTLVEVSSEPELEAWPEGLDD